MERASHQILGIVTNSITAIVLYLATASIGGIYTSTSPDMGAKVSPGIIRLDLQLIYSVYRGSLTDIVKFNLNLYLSRRSSSMQEERSMLSRGRSKLFRSFQSMVYVSPSYFLALCQVTTSISGALRTGARSNLSSWITIDIIEA